MDDFAVLLGLKMFNSDNSWSFSSSRYGQDTFVQKLHFSFKIISLDIFNLYQNKHKRVQLGLIMLQTAEPSIQEITLT